MKNSSETEVAAGDTVMGVDIGKHLIVKPGRRVQLSSHAPEETLGLAKESTSLQRNLARLNELQHLLYADRRHALLIVLQALDAGGKDGAIRHVMSGVNPQGCQVISFKAPNQKELDHDFLWRVHRAVPGRGMIGIFNRSHYEDVLVVRVHGLVPKRVWSRRYDQINEFERVLTENGTTIVKFLLHIDRDEQRRRFQARYDDPTKRWKVNTGDLAERARWDDYMAAFDEALTRCSTKVAPWYVIPANRKWFRDLAVGEILADVLEELDPQYPARDDLPPGVIVT